MKYEEVAADSVGAGIGKLCINLLEGLALEKLETSSNLGQQVYLNCFLS